MAYTTSCKPHIPLPACAYTKIQKEFAAAEEETFTGIDLHQEYWEFWLLAPTSIFVKELVTTNILFTC